MAQLKQAIQAIKNNDKQTGRQLLQTVLQTDPNNEIAWLWLAAVESDEAAKRRHLMRVLELNPAHEVASSALAQLDQAGIPLPEMGDIVGVDAEKTQPTTGWRYYWLFAGAAPLGLLVFFLCMLLSVNQEYIGRIFLSCSYRGVPSEICSQPMGWLMAVFGLALPVCGLLIVVGLDFWLAPERIKVRLLIAFVYLLFIIIPANCILALGPAALIMLETPGLF